jgi:hypothetical protein
VGLGLCLCTGAPAQAADPGRWVETGFDPIPISYYQGVTSDPTGDLFFDGFTVGVYRTSGDLTEEASVANAIPADVNSRERYNHIGDLSWDAAEGGRLLLPLECYIFGQGNFCGTGSFGVADPQTLAWRYYVKLDPAEIKKAMWAEVSPDGSLVWTSAGNDLLAYRSSDINPANAAPQGPLLHPVRRLVGAVPPSGVTGATFYQGRLFLAGQDGGAFQVWSIDTQTGERTLEIEKRVFGESEGLDIFDGRGGILHWQIGPISFSGPPTYGVNVLVHFVSANQPPDCSGVSANPTVLWPPNHKLRLVTVGGVTDPDGDPVTVSVTGVSPSWVPGPSSDQVWLRAERAGSSRNGSEYVLTVKGTDSKGATCAGQTTVGVPHDRSD